MPATVGSKPPPDPPKRKVSEESKQVESVKQVEKEKEKEKESEPKSEPVTEDAPAQPPAPETEVVKKPTPRKRLSEERKSGSAVSDRIPKTKAQRAKGSIALNKTLEKTDSECGGKKQASIRSIDRMSRPNTRDGAAIGEARKTPVAVRSKVKVKSEGSDLKTGKKRKPWVAVVEKASNETINEKTMGVVEQESKEVKNEEIRPINAASNSCSFFEKLQQGVRAYFGSRNSFNPSMDEKNKKKVTEGGPLFKVMLGVRRSLQLRSHSCKEESLPRIRTRARVGKGVKEDEKKTKPGKIVKNKKYSSESDLWYNQFRVNSSEGGQSNTSLIAKPKIFRHFRKLKRKKLYCPTKHCVRIQIPRKGYFYRSTVQFKAPGSAPSTLCPQRMESRVLFPNESKVQIPRVAATNPKGPNLLKKRLKKNRKPAPPRTPCLSAPKTPCLSAPRTPCLSAPRTPCLSAPRTPCLSAPRTPCLSATRAPRLSAPRTPSSTVHIEHLGTAPSNELAIHNLDQRASGSGTSGFFPARRRPSGRKSKPPREASPAKAEERQIREVLESPASCDNAKPKTQAKRKLKSKGRKKASPQKEADDSSDLLETSSERVISMCKVGIKSPQPSDTSFETLISCISSVLGKDEGFYDLQISPVVTGAGESSLESDIQILANSPASQSLQITEVVTAFEKYDDNSPDYLSPKASLTLQELNDGGDYGPATEDTIARMLIGEIDLHVELENYLRDIECFNGVRTRTKNTLQCNLCEDLYPLSDGCLDLQNRTNDFFELTEIKSNSTFASATSVCTQQDADTDKLRVFLDRNASMSEEYFDSRNTKMFISEMQFTDKAGDIRKIKSDNDPKKLKQDCKLKSSIKRTLGNTSFQPSRPGEEKWELPPLQSEHSTDSYEKILPFGWHPNKNCDEVKNQTGLQQKDPLPAEMLPTGRKSSSESGRREKCTKPVENGSSSFVPQLVPEQSSFDKMITRAIPQLQSKRRRLWSPSMQELIEIYNRILKQNKKIRNDSRTSVSRCISSHLFSFLNEELKEKECKANLVMLASDLKKKLKTPRVWKPGRQKNDNTLEKYVTMFQEILRSSLSIDQITRLNNIISGLQEYSEKNYDLVKNMKVRGREDSTKKTDSPRLGSAKSGPPKVKSAQETTSPLTTPTKPRKASPTAEKPMGSTQPSSPQKKSERTTPKKGQEVVPMEEITKIELTSPTELESILQSCFGAEDVVGTHPRDSRDKILVTVKLRGNQVLVSKLTYFKNERSLSPGKAEENGTSELIIENVTKDKVKAASPKSKKSGTPRQPVKIVEPKIPKPEIKTKPVVSKKVKRRPKAKSTVRAPKKDTYIERFCNTYFSKEPEHQQPNTSQPFEYDQMLLRAQHPIEAIIERSESRLSEHVGSSDEDHFESPLLEPPPERTILLSDVHPKTTLKEALMETFSESVGIKELACDFNWNDEKSLDKSLNRAKSYVINREAVKKRPFAQKSNHAETVRSLNDLTKPRSRKKVRRKANSYMCFPSILNMQKKPTPIKKKSKKQLKQKNRSLQFSNSQAHYNAASDPQQEEAMKELPGGTNSKASSPESMSSLTYLPEDPDSAVKSPASCESDEEVPDCCSMELLYYDSESPSANVSPKVSASVMKTGSKTTLPEQVPIQSEEKAHRASGLPVEGLKGSPIVIHPPRNDSEDTIFHSVMIHSDSFLKKCYSSLALTQANLNSFLKSCSDVKFYPGRVSSTDKQQNPFVKFLLTPSQNANSGLPPNQVQVVDKKVPAEDAVVEFFSKERPESASTGINEKISLPSIEKFIRKLSKGKKKCKPKCEERKKSQPTTSRICPRKRPFPSTPKTTDRKPYHECQKRKLIDKAKSPDKKTKPADSKTRLNKEKPQPDPSAENSETLMFLKKFILTLSQVMESFSDDAVKNSNPPESGPTGPGMGPEAHAEKATNTTLPPKTSLLTLSKPTPDTPPRKVQPVKSVVTQTEDLPYLKDRTKGGCEGEMRTQRMGDNAGCALALATQPRKSKTLKIKIHCDDRKDGSRAEKTWQQEAENPMPVEGELQRFNEKVGLLDSLVMGEPEGGSLERRSSVYYDALEMQSDEENEPDRNAGRTGKIQQEFLTNWATVDQLSGGLLGKEKSYGDSSALMLSNSTLPESSQECVYEEILKSLQEDKICHSLTLLDDFLGKTEFSGSWSRDSEKLRSVLLLVCSKSINLMIGMEKSAWLKVLSLLEDISRRFGGSEDAASRDSQIAFVGKIRRLNDSRLVDLQNYCVSLSQTAIGSNSPTKKFFHRIKDSFALLRNRISPHRSHSANLIQSTAEAALMPSVDHPDRNPLHNLRKQIQKQKSYIEFLLSTDCGTAGHDVEDVEEKVVEKMKSVGSVFSLLREG